MISGIGYIQFLKSQKILNPGNKECIMNWIKAESLLYGIMGIFLAALFISADASANLYAGNDFKKQQIDQMYERYQQKAFPSVSTVMVEELLDWAQPEDIAFVDVRTPKERAVSMIPSAITLEELQENFDAYADHKIVYYCTIGYRSGIEAKKAQKKGLDAYNLYGGVLAWSHAGQPFVRSEGETRDIHVYGKKWNLTPQDYNPVW
jgi:rhodanese-related sulfurtransferase